MDHMNTGPAELARLTGISIDRWKSIRSRGVRASTEEVDACVELWPQYAYWLVTGKTQPEVGNIGLEPCEKGCLTKQLAEKVIKTLKNGPGSHSDNNAEPKE